MEVPKINCFHGYIVNVICNCYEGWITSEANNYGNLIIECDLELESNKTITLTESSSSCSFFIFFLLLFFILLIIFAIFYLIKKQKKKKLQESELKNKKKENVCGSIDSKNIKVIELEAKKTLGIINDEEFEKKTDINKIINNNDNHLNNLRKKIFKPSSLIQKVKEQNKKFKTKEYEKYKPYETSFWLNKTKSMIKNKSLKTKKTELKFW